MRNNICPNPINLEKDINQQVFINKITKPINKLYLKMQFNDKYKASRSILS